MDIEVRSVTPHMDIRMRALPLEGVSYFVIGLEREGDGFVQLAVPFKTEEEAKAGVVVEAIAAAYVNAGWTLRFISNIIGHLAHANLILPFA